MFHCKPLHRQEFDNTLFTIHMELYRSNQHAESRAAKQACRSIAWTTCLDNLHQLAWSLQSMHQTVALLLYLDLVNLLLADFGTLPWLRLHRCGSSGILPCIWVVCPFRQPLSCNKQCMTRSYHNFLTRHVAIWVLVHTLFMVTALEAC